MSESEGLRKVASEDELGEKWDRCIADTILKTGTGFGLGLAFSLLVFRRRPWPVALGTGFGLGYAISNCQHDFRRLPRLHLKPVRSSDPTHHKVQSTDPAHHEVQSSDPAHHEDSEKS